MNKPSLLFFLAALLTGCPAANDDDSAGDDDDSVANDDDTVANDDDATGDDDDATGDDDDSTGGALRTFMAMSDGAMGGPTGADALCAADANNPDTSATWKAMLAGTSRVACADADCASGTAGQVDWVFQPNTEYLRPEGGTLFTTDANGVFTDYPLAMGLLDAADNFWSGLDSDWTTYTDNHCTDWTSDDSGEQGRVGWTQSLDALWIQGGDVDCGSTLMFLCVEQ